MIRGKAKDKLTNNGSGESNGGEDLGGCGIRVNLLAGNLLAGGILLIVLTRENGSDRANDLRTRLC